MAHLGGAHSWCPVSMRDPEKCLFLHLTDTMSTPVWVCECESVCVCVCVYVCVSTVNLIAHQAKDHKKIEQVLHSPDKIN